MGLKNGWLVIYDTTKSIFNDHKNAIYSIAIMDDNIITGPRGVIKIWNTEGLILTLKGDFKIVYYLTIMTILLLWI